MELFHFPIRFMCLSKHRVYEEKGMERGAVPTIAGYATILGFKQDGGWLLTAWYQGLSLSET